MQKCIISQSKYPDTSCLGAIVNYLESIGVYPYPVNDFGEYYEILHGGDPRASTGCYGRNQDISIRGNPSGHSGIWTFTVKSFSTNWTATHEDLLNKNGNHVFQVDVSSFYAHTGEEAPAVSSASSVAASRDMASAQAAIDAQEIYYSGVPVGAEGHPYLSKKKIPPSVARFIRLKDGAIIIPYYNDAGNVCAIERIYQDGTKKHKGSIKGRYCIIGRDPYTDPAQIILCEGFSSAVAAHISSGIPSACCGGCGNVASVVGSLSRRFPSISIILVLDNDLAGRESTAKAISAASSASIPIRTVVWGNYPDGYDCWDLWDTSGAEAVLSLINAQPAPEPPQSPIPPIADQQDPPPPQYDPTPAPVAAQPLIDEELLPKIFRDYLSVVTIGLKPQNRGACILSALAALSGIIGSRHYIPMGVSRMYGNLWVLITGSSGGGKSFAMNAGRAIANILDDELARDRVELEDQLEAAQEALEFTQRVHGEDSVEAKSAFRSVKEMERVVKFARSNSIQITEATPEAMTLDMSITRTKLCVSEEMFEFIQKIKKNSGNHDPSMFFTQLHSSPAYSKRVQGDKRERYISNPALCMLMASTIEKLSTVLGQKDIDSGFLLRFCVAHIEPPTGRGTCSKIPRGDGGEDLNKVILSLDITKKVREIRARAVRGTSHADISRVVKDLVADDGQPISLPEHVEQYAASIINSEFYDLLTKDMSDEEARKRLDRYRDMAFKCCMLLDLVSGNTSELSLDNMRAALSITRYCIISANKSISIISKRTESRGWKSAYEKAERVFRFIRDKGNKEAVTFLRLQRGIKLPNGVKDLDDVLAALITQGAITRVEDPSNPNRKAGWSYIIRDGVDENDL